MPQYPADVMFFQRRYGVAICTVVYLPMSSKDTLRLGWKRRYALFKSNIGEMSVYFHLVWRAFLLLSMAFLTACSSTQSQSCSVNFREIRLDIPELERGVAVLISNGRWLVGSKADGDLLNVWRVEESLSLTLVSSHAMPRDARFIYGGIGAIARSEDDTVLAVAHGSMISIFDLQELVASQASTVAPIFTIEEPEIDQIFYPRSLALSPDGSLLLAGIKNFIGISNSALLWKLDLQSRSAEVIERFGFLGGEFWRVEISPDSTWFRGWSSAHAVGSNRRPWEGSEIDQFSRGHRPVAISIDSNWLVAMDSKTTGLYELVRSESDMRLELRQEIEQGGISAAFSPNGHWLIVAGGHVQSKDELLVYRFHEMKSQKVLRMCAIETIHTKITPIAFQFAKRRNLILATAHGGLSLFELAITEQR